MTPIIVQATEVKMRFGKYFKSAQKGKPVIIKKKNDNQGVVMLSLEKFEDLMEIFLESQDSNLQKQIDDGHDEYTKGKCEKGIEGLFEIMNETKKNEILGTK